jgi:nicotinamidase-related amidase
MVVDGQVGVMQQCGDAPRVIANVARAVARARAAAVPVVWVQHADHQLAKGSAEWQWVPELQPADGEALVHKGYNSSFEQTPLDHLLAGLGATHIVLAGACTNWCIRATAYAALERGYDLTLVADAHTTVDMPLPDGSTLAAASVVQELNTAMQWLAYPGRYNGCTNVDQLTFASPGQAHHAD